MDNKTYPVSAHFRWGMGILITICLFGLPFLHYRWRYYSAKRLRVVEEGKLYRSGRMTGEGLEATLKKLKIRTVINLMEESQDPTLPANYFGMGTVKESEICKKCGAQFKFMRVDTIPPNQLDTRDPQAIGQFFEIMDNEDNYPVLLHCRAGLHRTGVLIAAYRIHYHGWSPEKAWKEMRNYGFGELNCYSDNDYITQYICRFNPRAQKASQKEANLNEKPQHQISFEMGKSDENSH